MKYETTLQKIKEKVRDVVDFAAIAGALVIGYAGITVAVNVPLMASQAGIEYLLDQPKQEFRAVLKEKGKIVLPNTYNERCIGDFETADGRLLEVNDNWRILEGKIFGCMKIPSLELGKEYRLTTIGSEKWGYSLLEAESL